MVKLVRALALTLVCGLLVIIPQRAVGDIKKGVPLSAVVGDPDNSFLAVQVGANGRFNIGANPTAPPCGPGPTFTVPCSYNISYFWPDAPGTSFTTVRIDAADHAYGDSGLVVPPTDSADGLSNTSAEQVGGIRTSQVLSLVQGESGHADTARIRYVIQNIDTVPHAVGLRVMIDTMLNDNDGAPFQVAGQPTTTETDFVGASVPSFFDVFFDLGIPAISARGTLRVAGAVPPDRFVIAAWPDIFGTLFDFTVNPAQPVTGDSAIAVYWNPATLAPGQSVVLGTFYGISSAVGGAGLTVSAPSALSLVPGPTPGSVAWSPNPFSVTAFFTNSATGALLDVDLVLDLSTAPELATSSPNPHLASVGPGETVSGTWTVNVVGPGDAHYAVKVDASGSLVEQQPVETQIPELAVPPVINPLNPSGIHLQADGRFCADASVPCVTPFPSPGNNAGVPIPPNFEWQGITPLAFVPGPAAATPTLLSDHAARSFVYAAVDTETDAGPGAINFYLAYDFLSRLMPFQPGEVATVQFDVAAGEFAGRMVVMLHCAEGEVLVSGFDNGAPFVDRSADQLGIEGACGIGTSPNPSGDPFFDMFTDIDGVTRGFNVPHAIVELEIPLTRNLAGAPRPGGGVYDPSPAFWSASAPDLAGDPVLSRNMVAINSTDGSSMVMSLPPPEDTGVLPPDKVTGKCEGGVAKAVSKLTNAIVTCHIKAADAALAHKGFDEESCEMKAETKFAATKTKGCPACVDLGGLATTVEGIIDGNNNRAYCTGSTPFGGDDTGFLPPDKVTGKCEGGVAKAVSKLTNAIVTCHIKAADAALAHKGFDEESCEMKAETKFAATKTKGCPACVDLGGLATLTEQQVDAGNGLIYCAGTRSFSPSGAFLD